MLNLYQDLAELALKEFGEIVAEPTFVGGTSASPNKLRLRLADNSFVDIWVSADGDYSYHWEHRRQSGQVFRWDNAPHHPQVSTFPHHIHNGDEQTIIESHLASSPEAALREVLAFVETHLSLT